MQCRLETLMNCSVLKNLFSSKLSLNGRVEHASSWTRIVSTTDIVEEKIFPEKKNPSARHFRMDQPTDKLGADLV